MGRGVRKSIPTGHPLSDTELFDFIRSYKELDQNVNSRVYQRDELHSADIDWNKAVIINLQPTNEGNGTHWTVWIPNRAFGGGLYEMIQEYGQKIANLRRDPRKGLTLPGMNYAGPLNEVSESYFRDYPPVNQTDAVAKKHDILYHRANALPTQEERDQAYREADNIMLQQLDHVQPKSLLEKVQRFFVKKAISGKKWIEDRMRSGKGIDDVVEQISEYIDDKLGTVRIDSKEQYNKLIRDNKQNDSNTSFYFCSYGYPFPNELGTEIVKHFGKDANVIYQKDDLQKTGVLCGNYVLYVLFKYFVENYSFYDIVDKLTRTDNANKIIDSFSKSVK